MRRVLPFRWQKSRERFELAAYFVQSRPGTNMDGENDGIPCEDPWCQQLR